MEKTGNQKGAGLHWDIVLLCLINAISATFGGPWICAATVRGKNFFKTVGNDIIPNGFELSKTVGKI